MRNICVIMIVFDSSTLLLLVKEEKEDISAAIRKLVNKPQKIMYNLVLTSQIQGK